MWLQQKSKYHHLAVKQATPEQKEIQQLNPIFAMFRSSCKGIRLPANTLA